MVTHWLGCSWDHRLFALTTLSGGGVLWAHLEVANPEQLTGKDMELEVAELGVDIWCTQDKPPPLLVEGCYPLPGVAANQLIDQSALLKEVHCP
jgi:hypothetical protein